MRELYKGKEFRHYKGKIYTVLEVCTSSETLKSSIVYQASGDDSNTVWSISASRFNQFVTLANGEVVPRFQLIEDIE